MPVRRTRPCQPEAATRRCATSVVSCELTPKLMSHSYKGKGERGCKEMRCSSGTCEYSVQENTRLDIKQRLKSEIPTIYLLFLLLSLSVPPFLSLLGLYNSLTRCVPPSLLSLSLCLSHSVCPYFSLISITSCKGNSETQTRQLTHRHRICGRGI